MTERRRISALVPSGRYFEWLVFSWSALLESVIGARRSEAGTALGA